MGIQIGGLATGLDTNSLITQLMQLERKPIERLQLRKDLENDRLSALGNFDTKYKNLLAKIEALDTSKELLPKAASVSSDKYFKTTATSDATAGTYQIKTIRQAQKEKVVSTNGLGYADKDAKNFGTGSFSITTTNGGTPTTTNINIDSNNNSLAGIMKAINDSDAKVSATVINDGDEYRLVLTGDSVGDAGITLNMAGMTGGTYANPSLEASPVQAAQTAKINVDGINIESTSDKFSEAIPGVTLDLSSSDGGTEVTTLTVADDEAGIRKKFDEFVSAYNDILTFVSQATGKDGALGNDAGVRMSKSRLQSLLTSTISGTGAFKNLSDIGIKTDKKDGKLSIDSTLFTKAMADLPSVEKLMLGETGVDGMTKKFSDYLKPLTDSISGFSAGRKDGINSAIKRYDQNMESMERRLEQREKSMRAQFTMLEELVSNMNTQSSYISQQMSTFSQMSGRR